MDVKDMKQRLLNLEAVFSEKETLLTDLDRAIGDGDHGVNMLRGFKSLKDKIDDSSMSSLFKSTGMALMSNIGGVATAIVIFLFSVNKKDGITPSSMVLIGVGMQTALYGGSITLMSKFNEDQSEFIATWFAGNIWGDDWTFVIATIPWLIIIIPFLLYKSNVLNLINTHEHIAKGLGVKIEKERVVLFFIAVVLSSIAVAVVGAIAFIGLMGPHIAKSIIGPRHQLFLPISIIVGAFLLVLSDTIGKVILEPTGVPAGIVVAIIGAPYFIYLMYKSKSI